MNRFLLNAFWTLALLALCALAIPAALNAIWTLNGVSP